MEVSQFCGFISPQGLVKIYGRSLQSLYNELIKHCRHVWTQRVTNPIEYYIHQRQLAIAEPAAW